MLKQINGQQMRRVKTSVKKVVTQRNNTSATFFHIWYSTRNITAVDAIITVCFHSFATNSIVNAVACARPFD